MNEIVGDSNARLSVRSESENPIEVPLQARKLIAVGGGKGGVGKSTVATNLAVYFAQLGKRVVLVDADPTGANMHWSLGVQPMMAATSLHSHTLTGIEHRDETKNFDSKLQLTSVAGLRLLSAPLTTNTSASLKGFYRLKLLSFVRQLQADYIVVNVGPGVNPFALDVFLISDANILVTVPEAPAIETSYRFLLALFVHDLRNSLRHERDRLRVLDRWLSDFEAWPFPLEFISHLARVEPSLGEFVKATLHRMHVYFIINQARVRTDFELGHWMAHVASRRLGLHLDPLGPIEYDDAVWLAQRRRKPLLIDNPSSKSGRCTERVARRLLASLQQTKPELKEATKSVFAMNHYERLQVPRGASEEEVRRAYKRQREIFSQESLAIVSLYDAVALDREHALLAEAHDILIDLPRRKAYDISMFPNQEAGPLAPSPALRVQSDAEIAERLQLQATLARELGPDTEFTGAILRRIRESKGLELQEISNKTKISVAHLTAIEAEKFDELPPLVYIRGFLVAFSKSLGLDSMLVTRTYLRRARELIELRGH